MKIGLTFTAAVIAALFLFTPEAQAHGGRTDASGCHRDRSTGGRHCHNGGTSIGDVSMGKSKKKRKGRKKRR
jgi:hypothetical protein